MKVIERKNFDALLAAIRQGGYQLLGPMVRDGAIVYDEISGSWDLPVGLGDFQDGGSYRLTRRGDNALFGYNVGPHSWKKFLFPPVQKLFQITRDGQEIKFDASDNSSDAVRRAFIGVRSCDLHAIAIQDKVFTQGPYIDRGYQTRRGHLFIVAVNCSQAGNTCFCESMKTGPRAESGFDLSLTEIVEPPQHYFVVEAGSPAGQKILDRVSHQDAEKSHQAAAANAIENARRTMGRYLDNTGIKELLYENPEHPRWDDVAQRCLSCANCTMVCPTCFCSTVEDVTDLSGEHAQRWRKWDSCFNQDFSYIVGGSIRQSTRSRYRQWLTHKLAGWQDQFGTSGCVGCGRCITWCPVGIDMTQEVRALRQTKEAWEGAAL